MRKLKKNIRNPSCCSLEIVSKRRVEIERIKIESAIAWDFCVLGLEKVFFCLVV